MNNSRIYQYRLEELLQIIRRGSEFDVSSIDEHADNQVIDICGNAFREHQRIISVNESMAIFTVGKIVTGLFDSMGIEYDIPEFKENNGAGRQRIMKPFPFAMIEDGKHIGYRFAYRQRESLIKTREKTVKYKGIDGVKTYFLQTERTDDIDLLNEIETREDNCYLRFFILKDLFDEKFGEGEYQLFMNCVEAFNERAQTLIGYKTITIPTKEAIKNFKEQVKKKIYDDCNEEQLPAKISCDQKTVILNQLRQKGMYRVMLGDSDFADSFISSEWYYRIHTVTEAIDQTGLVTGYLKSVEQLLYALIRLSINRDKRIRIKDSMKEKFPGIKYQIGKNNIEYIDFTDTNEDYVDNSLGSLIYFIKDKESGKYRNKDLFVIDSDTIQVIIDCLFEFKDRERNDHLHKDNIYTSDQVNDIRKDALSLYRLLLGSFKISQTDYAKLMAYDAAEILPATISEDELYDRILRWITPILLFDMPRNSATVAFCISKFDDEKWGLSLQGLKGILDENYKTIEWNHQQTFSSSFTNICLKWESKGEYTDEINKLVRVLRKIINEDNEAAYELKKYPQVVVGNMEVIETLYVQYP